MRKASTGQGRGLKLASSLCFLFALLWSPPAEAYIDPGTGSALIYVVTGTAVSLYFLARSYAYRVLEVFLRRRYNYQSCQLAIHCESPRYEITFLPVMRFLAQKNIPMTFFTMYPRDGSHAQLPPGVAHFELAPGMVGYAYLNHIETKVLLTTTPQLDVMTFRRSKRAKHYIMMQHALGECRYVRPFAYDFFDTVLCCGAALKDNIRRMENIRGTAKKNLLETGVPHYDEIAAAVEAIPRPNRRPLVLVAPSWGPQSIFQAFGTELVERIAVRFDVLVRPHPQMRISQPDIYERILKLQGVEVDTSRTPIAAMNRADIIVSDISGIAHEFAFIHEKPVIVIDHDVGLGGLEGAVLGGKSELRDLCREVIVPISPEQMPEIADFIEDALAQHDPQRVQPLREQAVYNFGNSSEVAARQIEEILACQ